MKTAVTTKQRMVKDKLVKVIETLISVKLELSELNKNGLQFDYTTDSRLSDLSDNLERLSKGISDIIYQANE